MTAVYGVVATVLIVSALCILAALIIALVVDEDLAGKDRMRRQHGRRHEKMSDIDQQNRD